MTNGHGNHGGGSPAVVRGIPAQDGHGANQGGHGGSLDDILAEAIQEKHGREATDLQTDINYLHMPLLESFYKKGLNPTERATFEALPPEQRIVRLRQNNYKLKPELAGKLVDYLAVVLLKRHNGHMGSQLEAAIVKADNQNLPVAERAQAMSDVQMYKAMLTAYGFNAFEMAQKVREQGVSGQIWQESVENIGRGYLTRKVSSAKALIPQDQALNYIDTVIKPATGIDERMVKGKGVEHVKDVMIAFNRYRKAGDLEGFRREYSQYHAPQAGGGGGHA